MFIKIKSTEYIPIINIFYNICIKWRHTKYYSPFYYVRWFYPAIQG